MPRPSGQDGWIPRPCSDGILVLDSQFWPLYANPVALQILTFPKLPEEVRDLEQHVSMLMRAADHDFSRYDHFSPPRPLISGRRRYACWFFPIGEASHRFHSTATAVVMERSPRRAVDVARIAAEFDLTRRESETVGYLIEGLTSKEIAQRMGISPNTVKVFLRLAMLKMGVTTRSGIIGMLVKIQPHSLARGETAGSASAD